MPVAALDQAGQRIALLFGWWPVIDLEALQGNRPENAQLQISLT
jgi:hypothetical protein